MLRLKDKREKERRYVKVEHFLSDRFGKRYAVVPIYEKQLALIPELK